MEDSPPTFDGIAPPGEPRHPSPSPSLQPPQVIDRYRILECLGVGGMGTVYKAEQRSPVRRVVALKLIKPGFDSPEVIARFQSERQALARMDHPGIARILDAGADEHGRPYFVMEFVPGVPITTFCDKNRLSIPDRLALFTQACHAVSHAHTKAILHRDIKASNVLAYVRDGKPAVKVIDFGIAKALTGERLTDRTLNTRLGSMVGTYESMSPEQADGSPDIDTRTDVYSLGVLLYELLTGSPPFDRETLARAADDEIRRIIREQEPARPSTRLMSMAETRAAVAAARQARVEQLARDLENELEWIPLKAMRKERDARYDSAAQLAQDVANYLEHRPLIAGPESRTYRAAKFLRKHRLGIGAAAAVVVVLVAGLLSSSALYVRAEQALHGERRSRAAAEAERAEADAQRRAATAARAAAELNAYSAGVAAAQAALESGDLAPARRHLLGAPPSLRGFEWQLLWSRLDDTLATLYGHSGIAFCTAFSRDGKRLASGGGDGNVMIFDARTGERVQTLLNHLSPVRCVAFSPDGALLAAASDDGKVRVWQIARAAVVREIAHPDGGCRAVAFHPTSGRLLTGSAKGGVHFWDVGSQSPTPARTVVVPGGGSVYVLALSSNGGRLAVGTKRNHAVFDTASGECLYQSADNRESSDIAINPDGTRVAYATGGGHKAYCFDLANPSRHVFMGIGMSVEAGAGDTFVLASRDNVYMVDAATGQANRTLHCGDVAISYIGTSISPDRHTLAAGTLDGRVVLARLDVSDPLRHYGGNGIRTLSPDATRVLAAEFDGNVRVFSIADNFRQLLQFRSHPDGQTSGCYSPDGRMIATCGADRAVRLWDANTGVLHREFRAHGGAVRGVAFSPDGSRLASAGANGELCVWSTRSQSAEPVQRFTTSDRTLTCVSYSPDGAAVAAGAEDGAVFIARPMASTGATAAPTRLALHTQPVFGVCFSPDGRRVLSGASDSLAFLSDPAGVEPSTRLEGHTRTVASVAFTTDGKRVLTGSFDQTVRIWDSASGRELLKVPTSGFTAAVQPFPDGERVLVGNWANTSSIDLKPLVRRVAEPVQGEAERLLDLEPAERDARLDELFASSGVPSADRRAMQIALMQVGSVRAALAYRRVLALYEQGLPTPEVVQQLQSDPSLDSATRALAARLAASCAGEAQLLYLQHWTALRTPTQPNRWPAALEAMTEACRQLPANPKHLTALGLAQYRVGRLDEAMQTLARAAELDQAPNTLNYYPEQVRPRRPALLAAMAMLHHRQGRADESAKCLRELEQLATDPAGRGDPDVTAFLNEARGVLAPSE